MEYGLPLEIGDLRKAVERVLERPVSKLEWGAIQQLREFDTRDPEEIVEAYLTLRDRIKDVPLNAGRTRGSVSTRQPEQRTDFRNCSEVVEYLAAIDAERLPWLTTARQNLSRQMSWLSRGVEEPNRDDLDMMRCPEVWIQRACMYDWLAEWFYSEKRNPELHEALSVFGFPSPEKWMGLFHHPKYERLFAEGENWRTDRILERKSTKEEEIRYRDWSRRYDEAKRQMEARIKRLFAELMEPVKSWGVRCECLIPGDEALNESDEILEFWLPKNFGFIYRILEPAVELLKRRYSWSEAQATHFLFRGDGVAVREFEANWRECEAIPALTRIVMVVDPTLSPEEVRERYRAVRKERLPHYKPLSAKSLNLAGDHAFTQFMAFQGFPSEANSWRERLDSWNARHKWAPANIESPETDRADWTFEESSEGARKFRIATRKAIAKLKDPFPRTIKP